MPRRVAAKALPKLWSNYGPVILSQRSETSFGSHPCRVVSVSYEKMGAVTAAAQQGCANQCRRMRVQNVCNGLELAPNLGQPPDGRHSQCVIDEKKNRKDAGGEPACTECYCMKLKCVCKYLIIKEILVEATGVELITMLTTRKLLILGSATTAKKAPFPDPLYVYCTKMLFALESR
jgi:hypothetical protein